MTPTKETILRILTKAPNPSDDATKAQYLATELAGIAETKRKIALLANKAKELRETYDEEMKLINAAIIDIQANCKHWSTSYYNDPSGGNDSETICDICEKSLKSRTI